MSELDRGVMHPAERNVSERRAVDIRTEIAHPSCLVDDAAVDIEHSSAVGVGAIVRIGVDTSGVGVF